MRLQFVFASKARDERDFLSRRRSGVIRALIIVIFFVNRRLWLLFFRCVARRAHRFTQNPLFSLRSSLSPRFPPTTKYFISFLLFDGLQRLLLVLILRQIAEKVVCDHSISLPAIVQLVRLRRSYFVDVNRHIHVHVRVIREVFREFLEPV